MTTSSANAEPRFLRSVTSACENASNDTGLNALMLSMLRELQATLAKRPADALFATCKTVRDQHSERFTELVRTNRHPPGLARSFCTFRTAISRGEESTYIRAFLGDSYLQEVWRVWLLDLWQKILPEALRQAGWMIRQVENRGPEIGVVFKPDHGTRLAYVYTGREKVTAGTLAIVPITPPPQARYLHTQPNRTRVYAYNFPLLC